MPMRQPCTRPSRLARLGATLLVSLALARADSALAGPIEGSELWNQQQAQQRELDALRERLRERGNLPGAAENQAYQDQLRREYEAAAGEIRQKYLRQDPRAQQIKDTLERYKDVENTGSMPKDVRSDVDLNAKTNEAAEKLAGEWKNQQHVVEETPWKIVDKTTDTTLWKPCDAECMNLKVHDPDAWTTEGGLKGTGNAERIRDPQGYYLDNEKKFIHGQQEVAGGNQAEGLKTTAKSIDKAAERAGIKDPNDPFWKQSESLRNYGDPVEAGIANPADSPEVQRAKVDQWLKDAESRMLNAKGVLTNAGAATDAARGNAGDSLHNSKQADPRNANWDRQGAGAIDDERIKVRESNDAVKKVNAEQGGIGRKPGTTERAAQQPGPAQGGEAGGVGAEAAGVSIKRVAGGAASGAVAGAATTYVLCMVQGGTNETCLKAAGESIPESAFWGAVAAIPPHGPLLAAGYGAYQGGKEIIKLGGEGAKIIGGTLQDLRNRADLQASREANSENTEQFRERLGKIEAQVKGLEQRGAELSAAATRASDLIKEATVAADEARRLENQMAGFGATVSSAAAACKITARLVGSINAKLATCTALESALVSGLDEARNLAANCKTKRDAAQLSSQYVGLAVSVGKMKAAAAEARKTNTVLETAAGKVEEANGAVEEAEAAARDAAAEAAAARQAADSVTSLVQQGEELGRRLPSLVTSLNNTIEAYAFSYPSTPMMRGLVDGWEGRTQAVYTLSVDVPPTLKGQIATAEAQAKRAEAGKAAANGALVKLKADVAVCANVTTQDDAVADAEASAAAGEAMVENGARLLETARGCGAGAAGGGETAGVDDGFENPQSLPPVKGPIARADPPPGGGVRRPGNLDPGLVDSFQGEGANQQTASGGGGSGGNTQRGDANVGGDGTSTDSGEPRGVSQNDAGIQGPRPSTGKDALTQLGNLGNSINNAMITGGRITNGFDPSLRSSGGSPGYGRSGADGTASTPVSSANRPGGSSAAAPPSTNAPRPTESTAGSAGAAPGPVVSLPASPPEPVLPLDCKKYCMDSASYAPENYMPCTKPRINVQGDAKTCRDLFIHRFDP